MNILVVLVPISLLMACAALAVFVWTLRSKQYDDLEGDAWRILMEEEAPESDLADERNDGARS